MWRTSHSWASINVPQWEGELPLESNILLFQKNKDKKMKMPQRVDWFTIHPNSLNVLHLKSFEVAMTYFTCINVWELKYTSTY